MFLGSNPRVSIIHKKSGGIKGEQVIISDKVTLQRGSSKNQLRPVERTSRVEKGDQPYVILEKVLN